jgi:hypothetical protein
VADNTHLITSGFSTVDVKVTTALVDLHRTGGTLAPGAQVLGDQPGPSNKPYLVVIECGDLLSNGQAARARRVALPWGGQLLNPMAFSTLNASAMTILKRSLVWAAAPPVYGSVGVTLTAGKAPAASVRVELVNRPRVPIP